MAHCRNGVVDMADKIKFAVALALVIAGLWGYYQLAQSAAIVRLASVLAGLAAGAGLAWFTAAGQQFFAYAKDSVEETKKVAWPSRKESIQTALAVFGFVVVMAIFLWFTDKTLEFLMYDLLLGWKK